MTAEIGHRLDLDTAAVVAAFHRNNRNRSATARELGCSPTTVAYHLAKAERESAKEAGRAADRED